MKIANSKNGGGHLLNNAFTLIELLAVIIILAIIALIATPIILNVISDARVSAGRSEANMIYSGINNYCETSAMGNQLNGEVDICADGVTKEEVSQMVNLGNATIIEVSYSNGKVINLVVESNNHTFKLCGNGIFVIDDEVCIVTPPVVEIGESLISLLLEQYNSNNTTGLLQDEEDSNIYYYKGTNEEVNNNYLWYGGHQWRVMEIDTKNNTLLLITQQPLTSIPLASKPWSTVESYQESYINSWANEYFYNSLDDKIKYNIVESRFYLGTDMTSMYIDTKVGVLDQFRYEKSGGQNSYLNISDCFLLGNYNGTNNVKMVDENGNIIDMNTIPSYRAVLKIKDIKINEGDGTLESNYKTNVESTNTSDIQVGEYINVPYEGEDDFCGEDNKCIFRVVSKDSDSIKVVLNGFLPTTSVYGDTITITTSHTVYALLNTFANNISSDYRYTDNKVFYIGNDRNYLNIRNEKLLANVGLPTVGELFSGNDIDIGATKVFVDVNTIENPKITSNYWTMNRYQNNYVYSISSKGVLGGSPIEYPRSIRPVIFLKNNLNFVSGNGTAQDPYELQ